MKIRVVKTASNAKAVQVVRYQENKRIIMKHIGSSHTKEGVDELKLLAEEWMKSIPPTNYILYTPFYFMNFALKKA